MNIERTWWFKGGVGVLTVLSAVALFYFAAVACRSKLDFRVVGLFFCLVGYSALTLDYLVWYQSFSCLCRQA